MLHFKKISAKAIGLALTACLLLGLLLVPAAATNSSWNEPPNAPVWKTGRGSITAAETQNPWPKNYYSANDCTDGREYALYKNGTAESNKIGVFRGYYSYNMLNTLAQNGYGTYYFKMRALEVYRETDKPTGTVSPWTNFSSAFTYAAFEGAKTQSLDLWLNRNNYAFTQANGYLEELTDYNQKVQIDRIVLGRSGLYDESYPCTATITVTLPYGSAAFDKTVAVTVNGQAVEAAAVQRLNDLTAQITYRFNKTPSDPLVQLGNGSDWNYLKLTNNENLGKELDFAGGKVKLTEDGSGGYILELTDVILKGSRDKALTSIERNSRGNFSTVNRNTGIYSNRNLKIVLNGNNVIKDDVGNGIYYGIVMAEQANLTVAGTGSLSIYPGAWNQSRSNYEGRGIVTSDVDCGVTLESGSLNIYCRGSSTCALAVCGFTQTGGSFYVDGGVEDPSAIILSPYGNYQMLGGTARIFDNTGYADGSTAALLTYGAPVSVTGGELLIYAPNADYAIYGHVGGYQGLSALPDSTLTVTGGNVRLTGGTAAVYANCTVADGVTVKAGNSVGEQPTLTPLENAESLSQNTAAKTVAFNTPLEITQKTAATTLTFAAAVPQVEDDQSADYNYLEEAALSFADCRLVDEFWVRDDGKYNWREADYYDEYGYRQSKNEYSDYEAGHSYTYGVTLRAKAGFVFLNQPLTFSFNGKTVTGTHYTLSKDGKEITVTNLKTVTILTAAEVQNATLDLTTGEVKFTAEVPAQDQEKYQIVWEKWNSSKYEVAYSNKSLNLYSDLTSFEGGVTYRYSLRLCPKEGYAFAKELTLKINGQTVAENGECYSESAGAFAEIRKFEDAYSNAYNFVAQYAFVKTPAYPYTLKDAYLLAQSLAGQSVTLNFNGDVNGDNETNLKDVVAITRKVLG